MSRVFRIRVLCILSVILPLLVGCTGMVETELQDTKEKLENLRKEVEEFVQKQLEGLQTAVDNLKAVDSLSVKISSYVKTENGYDVELMDGTKFSIHDGKDGRTLPVGVRQAEDSVYYWTVDGEWLMDADSAKVHVGAVDGKDVGIPEIFVDEDGFWKISFGGGEPVVICEYRDGKPSIFKSAVIPDDDPKKMLLTLYDGTVLELPVAVPFRMAFSGPVIDTVFIDPGETLAIPFEILMEGDPVDPLVVTSGTDGTYFSRVMEGAAPGTGVVEVTAPDPFTEGYIVLSAWCSGFSAVKMINFLEKPKAVTVRAASGESDIVIPITVSFGLIVSDAPDWLEAVPDPDNGNIVLHLASNPETKVREGTVTLYRGSQPELVAYTITVYQATAHYTCEIEPGSSFALLNDGKIIGIPVEGGDAGFWVTYGSDIEVAVPEDCDWLKVGMTGKDGFWHLTMHADINTSSMRTTVLEFKSGSEIVAEIRVVQIPKSE